MIGPDPRYNRLWAGFLPHVSAFYGRAPDAEPWTLRDKRPTKTGTGVYTPVVTDFGLGLLMPDRDVAGAYLKWPLDATAMPYDELTQVGIVECRGTDLLTEFAHSYASGETVLHDIHHNNQWFYIRAGISADSQDYIIPAYGGRMNNSGTDFAHSYVAWQASPPDVFIVIVRWRYGTGVNYQCWSHKEQRLIGEQTSSAISDYCGDWGSDWSIGGLYYGDADSYLSGPATIHFSGLWNRRLSDVDIAQLVTDPLGMLTAYRRVAVQATEEPIVVEEPPVYGSIIRERSYWR